VVTNTVTSWIDVPYGGGIYVDGGAHNIRHTLVAYNSATRGDGIYLNGGLQLYNSTVAGNFGNGVWRNNGTATITNSIIWNNGDDLYGTIANASYSCIEDGDFNGTNNCVMTDPLFADTVYYHLLSKGGYYDSGYFSGGTWKGPGFTATTSPLVDAGDPSSPYDSEPDPNGKRINIGAYGNTSVASKTYGMPGSVFMFK